MIEPFELESIRLQAPQPSGTTGTSMLMGQGTVDEQTVKTMSSLNRTVDDIVLDKQQVRIYQSKIGNPATINTHEAALVPERIVSLGPLAPYDSLPTVTDEPPRSTSELLSKVLDGSMSHVPNTNLNHLPAFSVHRPDQPFLNPGLTSIDSRKLSFNWV